MIEANANYDGVVRIRDNFDPAADAARFSNISFHIYRLPEGELMDLAAASGVGDRVMFFPPQPQIRLADFYSAAELVLVPSRSESFGLVALEAQACGTPVVAAATGGLRYVVEDGETGFLVAGWDPADYAERLLLILDDRAGARRMGDAAVRRALKFSWDSTAADVLSVYREVLEGK